MFQALHPLVPEGAKLNLSLSSNTDGTLTVVVAPQGNGALAQPLVLTATPAELDAEFVGVIGQFGGARKSLAEQVEATAAVLEAAKQESAASGVKALTKATSGTIKDKVTPSSDDGDGPDEDDDDPVTPQAATPQAATSESAIPNLFAL